MKFEKISVCMLPFCIVVYFFTMHVCGDEYVSCSQVIESNVRFKHLPQEYQDIFLGIANEIISSPDVRVSFNDMPKQRKNEFIGKLNSWCDEYIQTGRVAVDHIEVRKKDFRHLLAKYFYLPVFSASPDNLKILMGQKEQLKKNLLQHYEKQGSTSAQDDFIKKLIDGLVLFYDDRVNSNVTPSMKYPLSDSDFDKLLSVLLKEIDKICIKNLAATNRPLQMEVMTIAVLIEQTYYQAIPKEVLDDVKTIQVKMEKFLPKEDEQKKLVEDQLAENIRQMREIEKRFFEKVDEEIAMIAKEEQWDQLSDKASESTPVRFGFFRVLIIISSIIIILIALYRMLVLHKR
jgi:hypothetical protein